MMRSLAVTAQFSLRGEHKAPLSLTVAGQYFHGC
jgi:hypothetical protein